MPTQVQFRRGTTAQNNNFIGAAGEIAVDLDRMVLRVHDGVTAGGTAMVTANGTVTNAVNIVGGTQGDVPYQDSTGVTRFINIGAAGQVLSSDGTTATWVDVGSLTGGGGISADDVFVSTQTSGNRYLVVADQNGNYVALEADSGANAAVYNLATGLAVNSTLTVSKAILPSTSGIDIGSLENPFRSLYVTSGTVYVGGIAIEDLNGSLTVNNQTVVTTATIGNLVANKANNIVGGTAGQIAYQTAPDTTNFVGPGNLGEILVSGGAAAPVYTSTSSIYVGNAATANALNAGNTSTQQVGFADVSGSLLAANTATQQVGFANVAGSLLPANTSTQYVGFANIAASVLAANTGSQQVGFAANLLGGAAGGLPYQSAADATTFLTIGAGNTVLTSNGSAPVWSTALSLSGNLTVGGNLTVNGTTTYVNSTVTNIVDPIITIGGAADGQPSPSDDNKDRGIAFRWYTSGAAKTGFFGFDDSSGFFTFVPDATISGGEVMSGTKGAANINIAGGSTGQILYQSAANETGFIGPGSVGQILVSAGSAIPVYTNTGSIYVGHAGQADSINPLNTSTQKVGYADVAGSFLATNTATQQVGFADTAGRLLAANTVTQQVGFANVAGTLLPANTSTQYVGNAAVANALNAGNTSTQQVGFANVAGSLLAANTATQQVGFANVAGTILAANTGSIYVGNAAVANALNAGNTTTQQVGFADVAGTILAANTGSIYVGNAAVANSLNSNNTSTQQVGFADVAGKLLAANTSTQQVGFAANVLGGAGGSLVYQTGANATGMLALGSLGYVLTAGGSAPQWTALSNIAASTATNLAGGTAGQVPYQTADGATSFYGPGTLGQILVSGGTSAPTYTNTASIYVGNAATANALNAGNTSTQQVGFADVAGSILAANTTTQQVGFANIAGSILAANTTTQQVGFADNAGKWKTARTVTFTGDVTGSFTIDGTADVSAVALTVGSNTVTLGTDTTGDYVSNGATAGFGISGSTTGETQTFTVTSNATSTNVTSTLVFRDSTGGFSAGNINVRDITAATSTSTGALKVEGGVGIGGNLYVGGEIVAQKLTIQFTTVTTTLVQTDDVIQTLNTTQAVSTITGALQIAGGAGIGGNAYIGGNANVAGTVTHNGLVPTAGTAIDQIYTSTKSLTLTNAWQDTGISGTDLATGSYMIQVFANDSSVGGGHINMYYTGVMSWFSTAAGENSYSEIVLNRAGNAAAAGTIFLRVAEVNLGTLKLQISGTTINSGASNYAFSFRRMI
jgi:hypothetical protein